jgi:hypothetical protein
MALRMISLSMRVAGKMAFGNKAHSSSKLQTRYDRPASIAGVTRKVECTRQKL